jgi:hydrogenase maturation protease
MMGRRTLVVGVGSAIRGDDGVGPAVAESVARIGGRGFEWMPFDGSALDLLGAFAGPPRYDCSVVIDCMADGRLEEGEVARILPPDGHSPVGGWLSSHHAGILETLAMADRLRQTLPRDLRFYAVGVKDSTAFREGLSPTLKARLGEIATLIATDLGVALEGGNP